MSERLAIGPSMATFAKGASIVAESSSSCPRYYLARKQGFRTQIDPLYTAMGEVDEARYRALLQKQNPDIKIEDQINLSHNLSTVAKIYGFLDMKVTYPDGTEILVEKKSHISKSARLDIIRKKTPKLSHVAQLSTYLMLTGIPKGKIVCDYYELDYDCKSLMSTEGIEFDVELRGREIYVDGEKFEYSIEDLSKFFKIITNAIIRDVLPPRPVGKSVNKSPCAYCPLRTHCDEADIRGFDKEKFLAKVKEDESRLIEYEEGRRKKAELWSPKRKPKLTK